MNCSKERMDDMRGNIHELPELSDCIAKESGACKYRTKSGKCKDNAILELCDELQEVI